MKTVIFLLCALLSTTAGARDYYVSNDGNDSNEGTMARPWATIAKVKSTSLQPGDRVLFKGGDTWAENFAQDVSGTPGKPITYSSYGEGRPNLTPQSGNYCISYVNGADYIVISGFNLIGCGISFYVDQGPNVPAEHFVIEDNVINDAPQTGIFLAGTSNMTVKRNTILNTVAEHGMYVDGFLGYGDTFLIEANYIQKTGATCIQVNSNQGVRLTNVVIRYNYLLECFVAGLNNIGSEAIHFHGNVIDAPEAGIYSGCETSQPCGDTGTVDAIIENNTIRVYDRGGWSTCLSHYSGQPGATPPSIASFSNNLCIYNAASGSIVELYHPNPGLVMDNNVYWSDVRTPGNVDWDIDGAIYSGFTAYQGGGFEPNSLYDDPDLINNKGTDWYPNVGSPLIDNGRVGSIPIVRDLVGVPVPFGSALDIGAVESGNQDVPRPPRPQGLSVQ